MRYLEFAVASNFSFLRGASHPEELMMQAAHAGLAGMGLCDRNSVAGVVRARLAKREQNLPLRYHPGARLVFADGTPDILAYPRDRAGWGRLTRLLTVGNLRAEKGDCILHLDDLLAHAFGLELVVMASLSSPPPLWGRSPAEALAKAGGRGVIIGDAQIATTPLPNPPPQGGREKRVRGDDELKNLLLKLRTAVPHRVRLAANMPYRGRDRAGLAHSKELA